MKQDIDFLNRITTGKVECRSFCSSLEVKTLSNKYVNYFSNHQNTFGLLRSKSIENFQFLQIILEFYVLAIHKAKHVLCRSANDLLTVMVNKLIVAVHDGPIPCKQWGEKGRRKHVGGLAH